MEKIISKQLADAKAAKKEARAAKRRLQEEMDRVDAELRAERDADKAAAEKEGESGLSTGKITNPLNDGDGSEGDETPGFSTRYRAEVAAIVQEGVEKNSTYVGVLEVGQELVSLQIEGNRVRFEQGWVDIVTNRGKTVLTVLEEGVDRPPDPIQGPATGTSSPTWQNPASDPLEKDTEAPTGPDDVSE